MLNSTFELFNIVKQKPTTDSKKCPYCNSTNINFKGTMTTLVGFSGKDMNHKWTESTCRDCNKEYCKESKGDNVWFTDKNRNVIKGFPSCYEDYVYDCSQCDGGKIHRSYFDLEKILNVNSLSYSNENGQTTKHFRTFWKCDKCEIEIETKTDNWNGI